MLRRGIVIIAAFAAVLIAAIVFGVKSCGGGGSASVSGNVGGSASTTTTTTVTVKPRTKVTVTKTPTSTTTTASMTTTPAAAVTVTTAAPPVTATPGATSTTYTPPAATTPSATAPATTTTATGAANPPAPSAPPVAPGSPDTGTYPGTPAPPGRQSYPLDGKVHVYVDLADFVHDGQLAHFSFKAVNGTGQVIRFTRAAVAIALDGIGTPVWSPIYNLNGATYQYKYWYVRTGNIGPGEVTMFDGMVPIPDRRASGRSGATVACLQAILQVTYPGMPNASIESPVKSVMSCSEYSAG